jgi:hypothetical protein
MNGTATTSPSIPELLRDREQLGRRASFARWIESGEIHHLLASREGEPPPDRDPRDVLREQLAAAVEEPNATTDPDVRVGLIAEVCRLRESLGIRPGGRIDEVTFS